MIDLVAPCVMLLLLISRAKVFKLIRFVLVCLYQCSFLVCLEVSVVNVPARVDIGIKPCFNLSIYNVLLTIKVTQLALFFVTFLKDLLSALFGLLDLMFVGRKKRPRRIANMMMEPTT
ncbi:hypothetical protein Dimus_027626 [Dionaea muscipula]